MTSKVFTDLVELIKNLQPSANKKNKRAAYHNLILYINENELEEDDLKLVLTGDEEKKLLGLCDLAGKKNSAGKFKDSAKKIVTIIHELMYTSKKREKFREEFVIYEDSIKVMLLGEHYSNHKTREAPYAKIVIEIIKIVIEKRPLLEMSEFIRKAYIEEIKKALEDYEINKKNTDISDKDYYFDTLINDNPNICFEPRTWDDVIKLKNKKLLTTEFLSLNYNQNKDDGKPTYIDENKELEEEIINNFVDPLTKGSKKLNFSNFSDEERKKMHLQYESYDSVFFLEKLYADICLKEFAEFLTVLEENLSQTGADDDSLIDKNIYKYLDCKKLLDFLVEKFKNQSHTNLLIIKENLMNLQVRIIQTLEPLKTSFNLILKSKSSKEIILKFAKYFQMKDKIDYYLKFSNFEELADYLKKINVEIKEISQNRYIYGEFYDFFSKTIEHFKGVLMKMIKESSVNDLVIKHFRYLLEFDVEAETVDLLLNGLKEKMCEKIKNDLEFTENFEMRNFKEFYCDEFNVENLDEEAFGEVLKKSDKFIFNSGHVFDLGEETINKKDDTKKNQINVESILKTLYSEIKDFLFMMKVLEENINLKIIHLSSQKNTKFSTIVTEVYFTLFEKLKEFLFVTDFNFIEFLEQNYTQNKVTQIFENSVSLTKTNYQYQEDTANLLVKYYEKNSTSVNILFNENFNKNALQNLSNLLIDLFDLFEIYLDIDTLEALNDSKTVTIERIFMAFLNEKIISNLKFFNEESTINFFDTQLSIFNFSAFSFTKSFIKNVFKSYKSIIEFYINILLKTKDVNLNHEIIYYSLFFLLKSFLLKFYDFYQTEANGPEDYPRLNCLIVEIMKNYNYLNNEINTILKNIFKNKLNEYSRYLDDLHNFLASLNNMFTNLYVINASKILFNLFIPSTKVPIILNNSIGFGSVNYTFNFYEKYNDLLLYDSPSDAIENIIPIFTDVRSVFIDMIVHLAESIKVFYQLELENIGANCNGNSNVNGFSSNNSLLKFKIKGKLDFKDNTQSLGLGQGKSINGPIISIMGDIILYFLESLNTYTSSSIHKESPKSLFYATKENFKVICQLYFEIQLFQTILVNFVSSNDRIKDKLKIVKSKFLKILYEIKNINESNNYDETEVMNKDEIERKNKIIDEYSFKYSSYFKCFKIKV